MLNGIKFDSFNKLKENLEVSISSDIKTIYNDLYDFQFQTIFNTEPFSFNSRTVFPLNYRNILEKIKVLFIKENEKYNYYFYYDINLDIQEQNKLIKYLLKTYLNKFIKYNSSIDIKRNLIFEVNFFVKDNNIEKDVFQYLKDYKENPLYNSLYNTEYVLIKSVIKKSIRYLINYYQMSPEYQFWVFFNRPDKYIINGGSIEEDLMNLYIDSINETYTYQSKIAIFSTGLIGPNSSVYSIDDLFIAYLVNNKVMDLFEQLCFSNDSNFKYDIFNLDGLTYKNDRSILLLNQDFDNMNDYVYNELNFMKNNIYSFRTHIYNESTEQYTDANYIIDNDLMPNYGPLRRIYNYGLKYNIVTTDEIVADPIEGIITLYDDLYTDKIYILFNYNSTTNIFAHYARKVITKEGILTLIQDAQVNLGDNDNVVSIIEDNVLSREDIRNLNNKVVHIIDYFNTTIDHLIKVLPGSYNKELIQTNFYKLLRAFAYYLANEKNSLDELKNNNYLNILSTESENDEYLRRAQKEAIYNNFGSIINLKKKDKWDYEQYRNVVSAIYKVCLTGPTQENMQDAIYALTEYKNKIFELYKEAANPIFEEFWDENLTFKFAIQIFKDLSHYSDSEELYRDLLYLLDVVKPAQALFYIFIVFSIDDLIEIVDKADDDEFEIKSQFNFEEDRYGYDTKHTIITNREESHTPFAGNDSYEYSFYDLDLVNEATLLPDNENERYLYIDTTHNSEFKHEVENASGYAFFTSGTILRISMGNNSEEDLGAIQSISIDAIEKNYLLNNEINVDSIYFNAENTPDDYIELIATGNNKIKSIEIVIQKIENGEVRQTQHTWDFTYNDVPIRLNDLKGRNRTGYPTSNLKDELSINSKFNFNENYHLKDIGHFKCMGNIPEYTEVPNIDILRALEYSVTPGSLDYAFPVHYGEDLYIDYNKNIYEIKRSYYESLPNIEKEMLDNAEINGYVKIILVD